MPIREWFKMTAEFAEQVVVVTGAAQGLGLAVARKFADAGAVVFMTDIQAEKLDVDVSAGEAVLTGKVTLGKGDLKVSCPRIDVKFNQSPAVTW